jgi:glycogen operon protein
VLALRARQQRNFLATLLFSRGIPMLRAGDEIGQTQDGNNNAYSQDNATTWLDWELDGERAALLAVARRLTSLARRHPELRRSEGRPETEADDLVWYGVDGAPLRHEDWHDASRHTLGLRVGGNLLLLCNAGADEVTYTLPADEDARWAPLFDSARDQVVAAPATDGRYRLAGRSLALLGRRPPNSC